MIKLNKYALNNSIKHVRFTDMGLTMSFNLINILDNSTSNKNSDLF